MLPFVWDPYYDITGIRNFVSFAVASTFIRQHSLRPSKTPVAVLMMKVIGDGVPIHCISGRDLIGGDICVYHPMSFWQVQLLESVVWRSNGQCRDLTESYATGPLDTTNPAWGSMPICSSSPCYRPHHPRLTTWAFDREDFGHALILRTWCK